MRPALGKGEDEVCKNFVATCVHSTLGGTALLRKAWKSKRQTLGKYDVTADAYDGLYAEEQQDKYALLRDALVSGEHLRILDVGCGTGLLEEEIASKAEVLVGIDASRRMLMMAKKRTRLYGNVEFALADSDFLPFRDETFTHVLSFTLLQNLPDPSLTVKEIVRTARINSLVVISTLKKGSSREGLRGLLSGAGLSVERVVEGSVKDIVAICNRLG